MCLGTGWEIGRVVSTHAELMTFIYGLELAWSLDFSRIAIEMNFLVVVNLVTGRSKGSLKLSSLLGRCNECLLRIMMIVDSLPPNMPQEHLECMPREYSEMLPWHGVGQVG